MIKLKDIEGMLPGIGVGIAVGAIAYYYLEVNGHHENLDIFTSLKKIIGIKDSGGDKDDKKEDDKKDKKDDKDETTEEALRKRIGRKGMGKENKDMKLGVSGFKRIHNKRGTILVNGKRRLVEPDDGFDASVYDYERTFGDPKIENFSYGGLSAY